MNLVSRSSERAPAVLSSTASENLGKTRHESQNPLSPQAEKYDKTERPVVCSQRASQTRFSRDSKNFKKRITIERGDTLCAHNQSVQC